MTLAALSPRLARERGGLAVALALLVLVLGLSGLLRRADDALYDIGLALGTSAQPPDDIVIVAIDDASLAAMGRWPWPRAVHAQLLDRLAADRPRAILLDLLLSEPSADPADDQALAEALERAAPVVLPVVPVAAAGGRALDQLRPAASLGSGYRLGQADAELDPDGLLRRDYLHAGLGSARLPHVALALLDAARGRPGVAPETLDAGSADGHWQRSDPVLLRYRGGPGHFEQVSYADVLLGRVPPGRFTGRHVLVGVTATGLGAGYPTPLSGNASPMASVEIVATLFDSLRHGDAPRSLPELPGVAVSALLTALFVIALTRLPPRAALVLAFAGAGASLLLAWLLLDSADLWFAPTGLASVALLAYPLWSWRRLEAASRFVDDELQAIAHAAGPNLGVAGGLRSHAASAAPADRSRLAGRSTRPLEARLDALAGASQQLRDGRELLAGALGALPDPIFVVDRQGLVLLANPPAGPVCRPPCRRRRPSARDPGRPPAARAAARTGTRRRKRLDRAARRGGPGRPPAPPHRPASAPRAPAHPCEPARTAGAARRARGLPQFPRSRGGRTRIGRHRRRPHRPAHPPARRLHAALLR
ncbi:CHASE2 domain-containing protein [Derxia lacustris]|uniref:CHASE2 domain-containing protein n=1 Tax=Derxia lacustris TaxID=764842 RepID=UPI000A1764C7|nr:CHASE2 domain-containing protein [Derxia lacustris]